MLPRYKLPRTSQANEPVGTSVCHKIAPAIISFLEHYPHFVIVEGEDTLDPRTHWNLGRSIATMPPIIRGYEERMDFTLIRNIYSTDTAEEDFYSRTTLEMEPHTDILNNDEQPELVILQMLQRDAEGGESIIIPVQHLERSLDDDIINILGAKVDLGRGPEPILWGRQSERCIRLPSEFKKRLEHRHEQFLPEQTEAYRHLADTIGHPKVGYRFMLGPGEALYLYNTRVLHGRTALLANSERAMYRMRFRVGCLGTCSAQRT